MVGGSRSGVSDDGVPRAGSTPFWRKAGTSLFTYKSRAWRMRYAQAQFQLVKCKDDMAPVFGEGGNLPTRFFEY